MEKKIIDKINHKIKFAKSLFKEWNHAHELRLAEIDGMITALSILTGKEYYFDDNGLHER